jgi:hypothetical protein
MFVNDAKLLLVLASIVIVGSGPHGTHDHIVLSDCSRGFQILVLRSHPLIELQSFLTGLLAFTKENTVTHKM